MSPTAKKALLLVAILAIASLIGLGLYWVFVKQGTSTNKFSTTRTSSTTNEGLPPSGERNGIGQETGMNGGSQTLPPSENITTNQQTNYYRPEATTKLTTDYVIYPSTGQNGAIRYHNAADGKFYQVTTDGTARELSSQVFYNVSNVTWAPNQNKAVIEYPDQAKIVYDFDKQKQYSLPRHWSDFSFSSDGNQIAAKSIGLSPENRWLIVSNDDGTGTKLVEPMGENADKVQIDWSPSKQVVAFSQTGEAIGGERREVLLVGLNKENFKSLIVEGLGFEPEWSPTGKQLLYSVYSGRSNFNPELWITDAYGDSIGNNRRTLGVNTWADKCTFGGDSAVYCAVPRQLPQGAGMSREVATGIPDDLYKIDLKTGLKTAISLGDNDYTIKNISYDATHNKVIFTDETRTGIFEANL